MPIPLTIRSKILLLGIVPLLLISVAFFSTLIFLEKNNIDNLLADKYVTYKQSWDNLIQEYGQFLAFSASLIRQNKALIRSLKTGDPEKIATQTDNVWNQLYEKIDMLFFWNEGRQKQKVLFLAGKSEKQYISDFTAPLLKQVQKHRQSSFALERFPDGYMRLMEASPYFNTPGKPYNLAVQGIELETLVHRLQSIIGVEQIFVHRAPLMEDINIHVDQTGQQAIYHIDLKDITGKSLAYLEIHEDITNIRDAFRLARQNALLFPVILVLFSAFIILLFVRWLIARLETVQEIVEKTSQGQLQGRPAQTHPDELGRIERHIWEQGQKLQEIHEGLIYANEKKERESDFRLTINKLLTTALAPMPLPDQLETLLDIIFSVPWFTLNPKGSVFIVDKKTGDLELKAHRGFSESLISACSRISPGTCLCGQAAKSGEIVFANHLDDRHHIQLKNMTDHGHYCVPIHGAHGVIGVINLYVNAGHVHKKSEDEFLESVAVTMGGLIERRQLEERVREQAEIDELTGLPNRAMFKERLSHAIASSERTNAEVVVMFIDLDRFKLVNDSMGHDAGDELLQEASKRLLSCVRNTDTVARLGGDEFTVILTHLTHLFYIELVARRILEKLGNPFLLTNGKASISGSIGITIFPHDADNIAGLLKNADTAMYKAKESGRSAFQFYTESMNVDALRRIKLEEELRHALENEEFSVHYQPKADLATGKICAMEALVRWEPPGRKRVFPDVFIPLAEETGMINPLGAWVLKSACQQTMEWIRMGYSHLQVAVNLSSRQFANPDQLLDMVDSVLYETGLPAHNLELEITESMVMHDVESAIATMEQLKERNISLAMDDFGTGYSSLSALKKFPIRALKIDRSFVKELTTNMDDRAIVTAIAHLGESLGLKIIVEGIETEQQKNFVRNLGCDQYQGYLISRPLPADEFTMLLTHSV